MSHSHGARVPRAVLPFFILVAACASALAQEPSFEYRIVAPARVGGTAGSLVQYGAVVQLLTSGLRPGDEGARGWSVGVTADSGGASDWRIVEATSAGTMAGLTGEGGLRARDGFEQTELTTGAGNEGVVSAVILSSASPVFIPPTLSPASILGLTVEGRTPPDGCEPCRLSFKEGLRGSGQPVRLVVTHLERSIIPRTTGATVEVCGVCFDDEPRIGPWRSVNLANHFIGATRRVDEGCFEICSIGRGHGPAVDEFQTLATFSRADMQLIVEVDDLKGPAEAGVCMRSNSRLLNGAYMGVAVQPGANGLVVIASARPNTGGNTVSAKPVDFKPGPIHLGVRRDRGNVIALAGPSPDSMRAVMTMEAKGTDLAALHQELIMYTGSDGKSQASARFCRPRIRVVETVLPPTLLSVDPSIGPVSGGQEVVISGTELAEATAVSLAGIPAEIVETSETEILVKSGPSRSVVLGDVVVETPTGSEVLPDAYFYVGRGGIRGDCNCDGVLDISDASAQLGFLFLGNRRCCCFLGLDANFDSVGDISDPLAVLAFLFLGSRPPPPPFPEPGISLDLSVPCDLPPEPVVLRLSRQSIREGDLVTIEGIGFDPEPENNVVQFGPFRGEVVEASEKALLVEVPCLALAGRVAVSVLRIPLDLINPNVCKTTACRPVITGIGRLSDIFVELIPSEVIPLATSELDPDNGTMTIRLDRAAFEQADFDAVDIRGLVTAPPVQGLNRGSLSLASQLALPPESGFDTFVTDLSEILIGLLLPAVQRVRAVDGGGANVADSFFDITTDVARGEISLRVNRRALGLFDFFFDGGFSIYPQPRCKCDGFDPEFQPRDYGWCRFTDLITPCGGLPRWEWFVPRRLVMQQSDAIFPLDHPSTYSHSPDKRVMYNKEAYCHVRQHNLWNPCKLQKLSDQGKEEIPDFPCKAIVIKTQWRTKAANCSNVNQFTEVPCTPDPDDLYYHVDSGGQRRYLTLLHYTDKSRGPWHWADLYVDESDGGVGGCGGSKVGMPAGAPWVAPWSNYSMCTNIKDTVPQGSDCGNLEIGIECVQTCQGCHRGATGPGGIMLDFLFSVGDGPNVPGSPDCD